GDEFGGEAHDRREEELDHVTSTIRGEHRGNLYFVVGRRALSGVVHDVGRLPQGELGDRDPVSRRLEREGGAGRRSVHERRASRSRPADPGSEILELRLPRVGLGVAPVTSATTVVVKDREPRRKERRQRTV